MGGSIHNKWGICNASLALLGAKTGGTPRKLRHHVAPHPIGRPRPPFTEYDAPLSISRNLSSFDRLGQICYLVQPGRRMIDHSQTRPFPKTTQRATVFLAFTTPSKFAPGRFGLTHAALSNDDTMAPTPHCRGARQNGESKAKHQTRIL